MNTQSEFYPVCNLDSGLFSPESAYFVVFGATGDLSHRKIFPALFDLFMEESLPPDLVMLGFARKSLGASEFRASLKAGCSTYARHKDLVDARWSEFAKRIFYLESDLDDPRGYKRLADVLGGRDSSIPGDLGGRKAPLNALFYLAVGPEHFAGIARRLGDASLGTAHAGTSEAPTRISGMAGGWRRLVVEKPYGRDGQSARALTGSLHGQFREKDIFRIDHYLGKETVQNLLYLRFANSVFEPVWNRNHIEAIEISVFENEGIGQRGGYYDGAGAARDMLQNHLIQLMCLTTMEPPAGLDPENIRDEKVKVLRSIAARSAEEILRNSRRGQYSGYRDESKVDPDSETETYVALRLELDNWRFSGVPIILRTGKAFAERFSQIVIHFRRPPVALFAAQCGDALVHNTLTIRIQPDEGMYLRFNSKVPGLPAIKARDLRFSYREAVDYLPEAYERLISDALAGDSTLFIRADESEHAWQIIDGLESAWRSADSSAPAGQGGLLRYPQGSPIPEDFR